MPVLCYYVVNASIRIAVPVKRHTKMTFFWAAK